MGELRPLYFVLENVDGLLLEHARRPLAGFVRRATAAGYNVVTPIQVLNAADFGVPQRRRRAVIIGYRRGTRRPSYPVRCGLLAPDGAELWPTVKDAIADLPNVDRFPHLFERDEARAQRRAASRYAKLLRGDISDPFDVSTHRGRPISVLTGCLRTRHSRQTVARFRATEQGQAEPISRYIRLRLDAVAPTLRAGTGDDHGRHTAPRPIHPVMARCITVREAARLHSFPDWFQFHATRWHAFRQIGNAVPPWLARAVATSLREHANDQSLKNKKGRK